MGVVGCGGMTSSNGQKGSGTGADGHAPIRISAFKGESELEIGGFQVLNCAVLAGSIPILLGTDSGPIDKPCLGRRVKPSIWRTSNPEILELMALNNSAVVDSLKTWVAEVLLPSEEPLSMDDWDIIYEKPMVKHLSREGLRLHKRQSCIDDVSKDLDVNVLPVSTLFGAEVFRFKSATPIMHSQFVAMRRAAAEVQVRMASVDAYTLARDSSGKPRRDGNNQPLYLDPNGILIPKSAVPDTKEQPVFEWQISTKRPLFFAFGYLPKTSWKREIDPTLCNLKLAYDERKPLVPTCSQLKIAGFGINRAQSPDRLVVKVTADGATVVQEVAFGQTVTLQAGHRLIVWVTPVKGENSAFLEIDSMSLDTGEPPGDLSAFTTPSNPKKKRPNRRKKSREKKYFSDPGIRF